MLQRGADTLSSIVAREVDFGHFSMKIQFNPGRIVSSAAKVDRKSIAERKCFLCTDNLPPEQKGVETGGYAILCNPFPIFPEHFTIPHKKHIDQRIPGAFGDMLLITKAMGSRYSLFYNGPKCGASAPDHLHFQAGDFGFMSIDHTWPTLVEHHGTWLKQTETTRVASVDDSLRRFIVIESRDQAEILTTFNTLFDAFSRFNSDQDEEPMVNVITSYQNNRWCVIVFLRRKHRPTQFFLEGEEQILFSPASVDFGGVCITPVEKDFHRIDKALLTDMFSQLSTTADVLQAVSESLQKK
jgi:ATP adenylyltransferase/5',5'''-P-1,P-4-tetraphosphate phosphorylase II